jgi:hypothetical protein
MRHAPSIECKGGPGFSNLQTTSLCTRAFWSKTGHLLTALAWQPQLLLRLMKRHDAGVVQITPDWLEPLAPGESLSQLTCRSSGIDPAAAKNRHPPLKLVRAGQCGDALMCVTHQMSVTLC